MSNYASLKATINANIKTNGNQEITGGTMNSVLNAMVNTLGAGYQYVGVATPTNPGSAQTPDYKCFYIATTPGTYNNLGGLVVNDGEVAILKWDSAWRKDVTGASTSANLSLVNAKTDTALSEISGKIYNELKSFNARYDYYLAKNVEILANQPFSYKFYVDGGDYSGYYSYYIKYDGDADYTIITRSGIRDNVYYFVPTRKIVGVMVYIPKSAIVTNGNAGLELSVYPIGISAGLYNSLEKMVGVNYKLLELFEFGFISIQPNQSWVFSPSTNTVRTKHEIFLPKGAKLNFDFTKVKMYVGWRDENGGYYCVDDWVTQEYNTTRSAYYVIVVRPLSGVTIDPNLVENYIKGAFIGVENSLAEDIKKLEQSRLTDQKNSKGDATYQYYGKKIDPSILRNRQYCKSRKVFSKTHVDGTPTRLAQSMAYANGFVFIFCDDLPIGSIEVYKFSDWSLVGRYESPIQVRCHYNNAQFISYKIEGDEFPLLLLAPGNYQGYGTDFFYFLRIVRTNNTFSFSIYKTCYTDIYESLYNGTWVADLQDNSLWLYTYERGNFQVTENNDLVLYKLHMPDLSSQEDEMIRNDSIIRSIHVPHFTMQGATILNGMAYMPGEQFISINGRVTILDYLKPMNSCAVAVINLSNGFIESLIPSGTMENEGIFIKDGKMYVMSHQGDAEVGQECIKVEEYDFNNDIEFVKINQTISQTTRGYSVLFDIKKDSSFTFLIDDPEKVLKDVDLYFYIIENGIQVRAGTIRHNESVSMIADRDIEGVYLYITAEMVNSAGNVNISLTLNSIQ